MILSIRIHHVYIYIYIYIYITKKKKIKQEHEFKITVAKVCMSFFQMNLLRSNNCINLKFSTRLHNNFIELPLIINCSGSNGYERIVTPNRFEGIRIDFIFINLM
jgi:hypothetical protein